MKINVYAIHDAKIEAYMQPFYARTDAEAKRGFSGICNQEQGQISEHPGDFTLFKIGAYDDSTGVLTPQDPSSLGNALEYKITEQS